MKNKKKNKQKKITGRMPSKKSKASKVLKLMRLARKKKKLKVTGKIMEVKKIHGTIEMFSKTKLENSIKNAAKDAKLSASQINALVKEVSNHIISSAKKATISAGEIRNKVLAYLDKKAKNVSTTWRNFEKIKN